MDGEPADLEIDEITIVPHAPLSNPFVECLFGTVRSGFLDQVLFWNAPDLERKLAEFQTYYNAARGHASFIGWPHAARLRRVDTGRPAALNLVRWFTHRGGSAQLVVAARHEFQTQNRFNR